MASVTKNVIVKYLLLFLVDTKEGSEYNELVFFKVLNLRNIAKLVNLKRSA